MENEIQKGAESRENKTVEDSLRFRVKLEKVVHERFKSVQDQLKTRGVENFTLSDYINFVLAKSDFDHKMIEHFTPLEFKLREAMKNEAIRKKLEKLISG
jgi:hypothetical protein